MDEREFNYQMGLLYRDATLDPFEYCEKHEIFIPERLGCMAYAREAVAFDLLDRQRKLYQEYYSAKLKEEK